LAPVSTESVPRPRGKHPPSTRDLKADSAFCELLAQDLGLKVTTVRTELIEEPKVQCVRVVE
jgi:hypothetical protein